MRRYSEVVKKDICILGQDTHIRESKQYLIVIRMPESLGQGGWQVLRIISMDARKKWGTLEQGTPQSVELGE